MALINIREITSEIDARVCSLDRIAETLRIGVEGSRQEGPMFNITLLENRAKYIATMRYLHTELQKLVSIVGKNGMAAENLHHNEIRNAQESLRRAAQSSPSIAPPVVTNDTGNI